MATTSNENSNTSPASSRTTSRPSSGRGWRRSRSGASNPSRVSSGSTAEASPGAPLRSGSNVSIDENGVQRRASKPKAAMRWTKDVLKNSFDSLFSRESRDEQAPMMIFYKATARLKKCVRLLESATLELEQILGIEELHRCQTEVLNALEMVFSISNDPRESRDYRLKFSADVQEELQHTLLWETLLFAAELITDGRVLEGRERVTDRLRPTAIYLCDSFESVNRVLRAQAKKNPTVYTPAVLAALRQFDIAWTAFENLYVQAVVPCRGNEDFETRQEITILFSEGVLLGLRKKYITQTDIDDYEPMVMQAIPRLGVLTGILQNPEELVNYKWMADSATLLKSISERMVGLAPGDIQKLEIYLVEGVDDAPKGDMSAERADVGPVTAKPEVLHKLFVDISQVADDMCRGPKNKGHRQILSTLFKMYQNQPIDITSDEPVTRISNIDDVEITNDDDTDPLNDAGATTPTPVVTALPVSAVEVQGGVNSAARAIQGMGNKFGLDSVDDMVDHSLAENIVEDFGFSIEDFSVAVVVNSPSDRSATNTATSNTTTIYAALHAAQQRGAANRVPGTAGANTNEITVVGAMRIDANATASAIVSDTNQLGVAGPVSQLHRSKSGSRIVSSSNGNLSEVASPSPLRNSKSAIHLSESKSQGTSDSAVKLKQEDSKGTINISAQT